MEIINEEESHALKNMSFMDNFDKLVNRLKNQDYFKSGILTRNSDYALNYFQEKME